MEDTNQCIYIVNCGNSLHFKSSLHTGVFLRLLWCNFVAMDGQCFFAGCWPFAVYLSSIPSVKVDTVVLETRRAIWSFSQSNPQEHQKTHKRWLTWTINKVFIPGLNLRIVFTVNRRLWLLPTSNCDGWRERCTCSVNGACRGCNGCRLFA